MRFAIVGYGKMGKAVEIEAIKRGHTVVRIDPNESAADYREITKEALLEADACIDFTIPLTAIENAKKVVALGKPLVMGTTGWYDKMDEMKKIIVSANTGFIWSGNFSIGMNVFFRIIKGAAKCFDKLPEYDAAVYEIHHNQKKDSPGGSAQIIGKILLDELKKKTKIVDGKFDRKPEPNELHVASVRCGSIPGTHTVLFDCPVDTIELKHTARGREGFAFGAVLAAEFISNKKGFYNIDDLMEGIVGKCML